MRYVMSFFMMILVTVTGHQAFAQEIEEVIVTGTRMEQSSSYVMPGIHLKIKADFFIQAIELTNDSRDRLVRERELKATMDNLVQAVKASDRFQLIKVENDIVIPIDDDTDALRSTRGNRPDTSRVRLSLKLPLKDKSLVGVKVLDALKDFLKSVQREGRTLLFTTGQSNLSVIDPSQYRKSLLAEITAEVNYLTKKLSGDYQGVITNLHMPVLWQRSGITDMKLYIPYEYVVVPANFQGKIGDY